MINFFSNRKSRSAQNIYFVLLLVRPVYFQIDHYHEKVDIVFIFNTILKPVHNNTVTNILRQCRYL